MHTTGSTGPRQETRGCDLGSGTADPGQEAILADNRAYFRTLVEENKDLRPVEYERWVRMGWIT